MIFNFGESDLHEGLAFVSVIIPTKNEEKRISSCIESLENSDYPKDKFELIVIDGCSVDKTIDIVKKMQKKYKNIRLICTDGANTSVGRNIGIKSASGDIIINFSGHALAEKNFIRILSTKLQYSENSIAGVGCKDRIPMDQLSSIAQYIECITNTKLGGSILNQYENMMLPEEGFADSISFTAYKREIFEKVGFFDPALPSGDDAELNLRIRKAGYKLLYTPTTCVYRYRREKLKDFFWQMFNYGRSRMQIIKAHLNSIRLVYLIPALFVVYLFTFFALLFLKNMMLFTAWGSVFSIYFLLILGFSIKLLFSKKNLKLLIFCPILYFIQHFAYGLGLLLETVPFKQRSYEGRSSE